MLIRHVDSHLDHVPEEVVQYVLEKYQEKNGFFIDTFVLPEELPTLEDNLYGPAVGDPPVPEEEVHYATRPGRSGMSRLVKRPCRQTRTCTVIGGEHQGNPCIIFTIYGGILSPREPGDEDLKTEEDKKKSREFWTTHALAE